MFRKFTPSPLKAKNLIWLFFFLVGICVFSGGCGGNSGSIGGSGDADVEALNNQAFENSSETFTGTATDSNDNAVSVDVSNFYVAFSNVTTAAILEQSVKTAATTGTVTLSYDLTINETKQNYQKTKNNVELTETSSGVYAFLFNDLELTIDPASNKVTFGGKFKFGDTEYTLNTPIEIGVTKKTPTPETTVMDVNAVWNGGWVAVAGTASVDLGNGLSFDAAVKNISVFFESCDVASPDGSATMSALFYITASDEVFKFPLLFDREKLTVSRDEEKVWKAKTPNSGIFTISMTDETHAVFSGSFIYNATTITCSNVSLMKPTTEIDMGDIQAKIQGTWQSDNDSDNGGFLLVKNNQSPVPFVGTGGYFNGIFSNFIRIHALMPTVFIAPTPGHIFTSRGIISPVLISSDLSGIKLEPIFGRVYRFNVEHNELFKDTAKGVIAFNDASADKALMTVTLDSDVITAYSVFDIVKKTGSGDVPITHMNKTKWTASNAAGFLASVDVSFPVDMSKDAPFKMEFVSVDLAQRAITVSADGTFTASPSADSAGLSFNFKDVITRAFSGSDSVNSDGTITIGGISNIGYNTWFTETASGNTVTVVMRNQTEAYIMVSLQLGTNRYVFLVGQMKKEESYE